MDDSKYRVGKTLLFLQNYEIIDALDKVRCWHSRMARCRFTTKASTGAREQNYGIRYQSAEFFSHAARLPTISNHVRGCITVSLGWLIAQLSASCILSR